MLAYSKLVGKKVVSFFGFSEVEKVPEVVPVPSIPQVPVAQDPAMELFVQRSTSQAKSEYLKNKFTQERKSQVISKLLPWRINA